MILFRGKENQGRRDSTEKKIFFASLTRFSSALRGYSNLQKSVNGSSGVTKLLGPVI